MAITTNQLLRWVQTSKDKMKVAEILIQLAGRAENNTMLQQQLKRITLPPPFDMLEYMKHSNRKGYWRRKPYWQEHPTVNQLEARLRFSEINYALYGIKGAVERQDGTRIGRLNQLVGDLMQGKKIVSTEELANRKRWKILNQIGIS